MCEKKSFFRIGIIYTIGQVLSKAISFIMIPIYTRQLGAIEYGKLSLADTVMDFISTFLVLGIYMGFNRFYREYSENDRYRLKNTAINFAIFMVALYSVTFLIIGKYISQYIFNFNGSYKILSLVFIRSIISQFIVLFMCEYSLNYKAEFTVRTNLIMLIINISLIIYFVVFKNQSIVGIYKGYIYGSSIILIYLIIKNIKNYKLEFDINMFKKMIKFSIGLLPEGLSGTILNLSDRYFLVGYKGFQETGIYSIGYKFGMLINPLFISPFMSVFTPYKFQVYKENNVEEKLNNMFEKYHWVGLFIVLSVSVYSKIILKIFTTKEYLEAYKLIPLVLMSYFIYGKAEFYGLGAQLKNKTYINGIIMVIGALSNVALNILLIPKYSMYGAAIATVLSYIIINIFYMISAKKIYYINYKKIKIYKLYFIVTLLYFVFYFISLFKINLIMEGLISSMLILIYLISIIKLKFISMKDIKRIKSKILKKGIA